MTAPEPVLVGDVGGTHARFAIVETDSLRIEHRAEFPADDFESFDAVLQAYLDRIGRSHHPNAAAIGVAGPITKGQVTFTNRGWRASEEGLRKRGFLRALLINDFAAAAFSVMALQSRDLHTLGPELPGLPGEPISVLGAGTGFGVACLARFRGQSLPIATEGGHASFAPQSEEEFAVAQILARRFGHVSVERILSGPGLANVHAALCEIAGKPAPAIEAAEIVRGAEEGNEICGAALRMFCAIFGSAAGDFALSHGARGGVFIAGGIARKIEQHLARSDFRARFESKGRLSDYVRAIPTRLIQHEDAAFLGAALASVTFAEAAP